MTEHFNVLSSEEYNQLREIIAHITIYIAAADGEIDQDEQEWAEKVTKIRSYNLPEVLRSYYQDVGTDFHDKLEYLKSSLPTAQADRMAAIEEVLTAINPVLAKLDDKLGAELYASFRSFAKHVAKASGGFLGFFSIGPKEAELIELPMITPIVYEADED